VIGETITRQRGVAVADPYSGESNGLDWTTPTTAAVAGCAVAIGSTGDPNMDARDAVASDFTVYAPADADIAPADRLVIRTLTCEVVGRPFVWTNPMTGRVAGLVVRADVLEG